ncbi:class I SAM-dependent methyltransferase [Ornithinimicrobium sp. LYQ121]|uniref:class I SAM-dependent methyltransferase n=1 Tax=Ornithinimicrobium sp. LYQ121 TaxID=3378801 RepID=UPI003851BD5C
MSPSRARLVEHWNSVAPSYDRHTAWLERRGLAAHREWLGRLAHGDTLEVAIGTGANLPYYGPDVRLTGLDWSPAMVEVAGQRAADLGREVRLITADADELPFEDESFDTVVSTLALCCVPDVEATLREALRVLRPDGQLLLVDHVGSTVWPVRALQHVVELGTVPLQNEHFTRRPLHTLEGFGVTVEETERRTLGMLERVRARKA